MTTTTALDSDCVFAPEGLPRLPVRGVDALFPVHRIYCVGQNYREHALEMGASLRETPLFFAKPPDAVCTAKTIPFPPMTEELHHEVELVVALGQPGVNIRPEQAQSLVFGYAVGVDLTRRDLQAEARKLGRPWTTAKGFDSSAPISPIQPVAACSRLEKASIELSVNGESRQQGNIDQMIWSVPEVIAELSRYFKLKAGDLIFTGTPAGVGSLQAGDQVDCAIEQVGSLSFRLGER